MVDQSVDEHERARTQEMWDKFASNRYLKVFYRADQPEGDEAVGNQVPAEAVGPARAAFRVRVGLL
eukprot:8295509-Pyramimonas_sp.AAC.1